MKNKIMITVMLSLFTLGIFAQDKMEKEQKFSKEEMDIKKVIEDETMHFFNRDYDKWIVCVADDPMTYYSWVSPFKGENSIWEARGYDEVVNGAKEYMKQNPKPNPNIPVKTNYKFKVNGDMAFVSFKEGDSVEGSRVMEKKNGQWKILRMDALASKDFENTHKLYALQRMAGEWEVDMSTYKKEGGGSWEFMGGNLSMVCTPTGIHSSEKYFFHNEDGKLRTSEEFAVYSVDMENGKVGVFTSSYYPDSGWAESHIGEGDITENGALKVVSHQVGSAEDKPKAKWSLWLEGDVLKWSIMVKDKDNKQVYASSCDLHRVGLPTASLEKP